MSQTLPDPEEWLKDALGEAFRTLLAQHYDVKMLGNALNSISSKVSYLLLTSRTSRELFKLFFHLIPHPSDSESLGPQPAGD